MATRPNSNRKLTMGFALVLVLLLANALLSFQNLRRVIDNNAQVTHTGAVMAQLQMVLSTMQDAETGQRGYVITGQEPYLEPYNAAEKRIAGQIQELKNLIIAPSVKPLVPVLERQVEGRLDSLRTTIALRRTRGLEAARQRILRGQGKKRMDALRATIAGMERRENKLLLQREAQSRAAGRSAMLTFAVSALVGLALLALVHYIIGRDAAHRGRAAAQLKASSDRFGAIVSSTSQIIWTRDVNDQFVEQQPSWSAFTGQTFDELKGKGWLQAVHPDDRERVAAQWNAALQAPGLFEIEYRLRRHDGQFRDMAVRSAPVREEDGKLREWVGASTDITERKQSQAELRRTEEQMRLVITNAPTVLFATDRKGVYTLSEGKGLAALGLQPGEAVGRSAFEMYAAYPDLVDNMRRALGGETFTFSRTLGEVTFEVHQTPLRDEGGEIVGTIGVGTDITERMRAETQLHESQREFQNMANSIPQLAWMADETGSIFWYNQRWYDFTGTTFEEMAGWGWSKVHHPDYLEDVTQGWTSALKEQRPWMDTFPLRGRNGDYGWFLSRAEPVRDDAGRVVRWFGTNTDITKERQADAELQESEARKAAILETALDCIIAIDHNSHITEWNPAAEKTFGHARADVLGRTLPEVIIPPSLREAHYHGLQRYLETGEGPVLGQRIEVPALHADGHEFPIELAITRIAGEGPAMFSAYLRDISVRVQAEADLVRLARDNRLLLESTGEGIYGLDTQGNCTFLNPAGARMLGYALEDVLGQNMHELTHYRHEDGSPYLMAQCPLYQAFRDGKSCRLDSEVFWRRDGNNFPVECFSSPLIEEGVIRGAVVTFTDITERKRAEEERTMHGRLAMLSAEVGLALTRSDTLRDILQHCAQAVVTHLDAAFAHVWTLNETDNVLELQASAGLYSHLDGPHGRVPVGRFKIGLIASERQPHLTNQVIGDPRVGDQEWAQREGMIAFAGYPLSVEGRLLGVMAMFARQPLPEGVLRSLSTVADAIALGVKRKRAEEDLERAKHAAEEASRTKSLFLANMSHELRTPLNAILGYSEMLHEEAQEQQMDEFSSDLEKINAAGKHLLALINDILDLSKIEAGKMELYLEEFDTAPMLAEVAATAQPLVAKNANTLHLDYAPDLGVMRGDLTKVRQCLFNLLSNAAKFTKEGHITLQVRREHMESVQSSGASAPRDWMTFRIIDTGIGMSAEQILGLFQAFTQADASTTRKFGGTGLGLALTRRFSQMMGGDVTVQSVPGEGSIFSIVIPALAEDDGSQSLPEAFPDEAVAEAHEAPQNEPLPMPGTCVLVIDDDATQRDLLRRFLAKEGFPAQTASSGEEGLRMAHQLQPIAITLDVMMPGMDGWSVLLALKADPVLRDIPVIMLTMVDDKNRGYTLGAADYVTKPVDRVRLSQILNKYVCSHPPCPVLLVEDDDATREMMRAMLEKEGWAVTEATNGREALERVAQNRPNLILLDLMMPEMDGFEFAATLRRRAEWSSIPVVVLTAKDLTEEDRLRLNGYVQKVLQKAGHSREEMLEQVRDLVAGCAVPKVEE